MEKFCFIASFTVDDSNYSKIFTKMVESVDELETFRLLHVLGDNSKVQTFLNLKYTRRKKEHSVILDGYMSLY